MRVTNKKVSFLLPEKFTIEFEQKDQILFKSMILSLVKPNRIIEASKSEVRLSKFDVGIFNVFWNIFNIRIYENTAEFDFRDARLQNLFVFLVPLILFLMKFFDSNNFYLNKVLISSLTPFFIFVIFFSLGRFFIFFRILSKIKKSE